MVRFLDSLKRNRNECYCSFIFLIYSDISVNDDTMILGYDVEQHIYILHVHSYLFLNNIEKFAVYFVLEIWQIYVEDRSMNTN